MKVQNKEDTGANNSWNGRQYKWVCEKIYIKFILLCNVTARISPAKECQLFLACSCTRYLKIHGYEITKMSIMLHSYLKDQPPENNSCQMTEIRDWSSGVRSIANRYLFHCYRKTSANNLYLIQWEMMQTSSPVQAKLLIVEFDGLVPSWPWLAKMASTCCFIDHFSRLSWFQWTTDLFYACFINRLCNIKAITLNLKCT